MKVDSSRGRNKLILLWCRTFDHFFTAVTWPKQHAFFYQLCVIIRLSVCFKIASLCLHLHKWTNQVTVKWKQLQWNLRVSDFQLWWAYLGAMPNAAVSCIYTKQVGWSFNKLEYIWYLQEYLHILFQYMCSRRWNVVFQICFAF